MFNFSRTVFFFFHLDVLPVNDTPRESSCCGKKVYLNFRVKIWISYLRVFWNRRGNKFVGKRDDNIIRKKKKRFSKHTTRPLSTIYRPGDYLRILIYVFHFLVPRTIKTDTCIYFFFPNKRAQFRRINIKTHVSYFNTAFRRFPRRLSRKRGTRSRW